MTSADVRPSERRLRTRVLRSLDDEWNRLRRRPAALRRAVRWVPLAHPEHRDPLAELTTRLRDLDELCEASDRPRAAHPLPTRSTRSIRSARSQTPLVTSAEETLRWLVRAGRLDPLAARIVLQRVLPGVIHGCRPDLRTGLDERLENAIGTAWLTIRTFDERRRGPVAAAIISDATRLARHGPRRRTMAELPRPPHLFDGDVGRPSENDPTIELARTLRSARRAGVARDHLDLMRELVAADDVEHVARHHGVSTRTIRTRRRRAVSSVRSALGEEWCPLLDSVA